MSRQQWRGPTWRPLRELFFRYLLAKAIDHQRKTHSSLFMDGRTHMAKPAKSFILILDTSSITSPTTDLNIIRERSGNQRAMTPACAARRLTWAEPRASFTA
jgi:hypothetical protein